MDKRKKNKKRKFEYEFECKCGCKCEVEAVMECDCDCDCEKSFPPNPPTVNDDPVFFPIPPVSVPTDDSGSLFGFISVQAYYLPGAQTTRNGNDRFMEDMRNASQIWGFPIIRNPGGPIHLTESVLGANFSLPGNLRSLSFDNPSFRRLQEIHAARFPNTTKVIAVWYAPFSASTDIAGRSFYNIGLPDQSINSKFYHHAFLNNLGNDGNNNSTLMHELGHIFFGTATSGEDPVTGKPIPVNNDCDPASPNCSAQHNTLVGNLMRSAAGNETGLTLEQRQKASSTFLFL